MIKQLLTALLAGLLFGAGLTVSTMVDPVRVLGFLDIFGHWDPTLAFVMAGGLVVYLPVFHVVIKPKEKTLFGEACKLPTKQRLDSKLLIGATIFGIGWGLAGICPGPAIANLSGGTSQILMFVLCMLLGMIGTSRIRKRFS